MSKNLINSKLDELFTNINEPQAFLKEAESSPTVVSEVPASWSWEIDLNGVIVGCGKEIAV